MAIFSQFDNATKVDYRKYTNNRNVPFNLPQIVEKKIVNLMNLLSLDSASLDLIKGLDGMYYFLEVNPSGQFGNVSYFCNYYIEHNIVNYLISNEPRH